MSRVFGLAVTALGFYTGMVWLQRAGMGLMIAGAYNDQRAAKRKARDAYNASLKDRLQMVDLQADAPRTLALGRVRTVEGVRRRWVSGTNSEKLTLIVSFAGHEIDGYEAFYFDDNLLTLDGSGWVTTDRYRKQTLVSALEAAPPTGASTVVTLPHTPVAGSVSATLHVTEVAEPTRDSPGTVSVVGNVVTVTGYDLGIVGSGVAEVIVNYQHNTGGPMARIRPYAGTDGQNVGADLAAEYPGQITAADRFAGIALAVVDLIYDPDVYPQGIPNITAVLRGAKVLDPRTSTTAWSENPALLAYHYARWAQGWALPAAHIATADIIAAADVCDTSTVTNVRNPDGSVTNLMMPTYRCGIVISSAADPRSSMDDILEAMAGRSGWAGGTWRLRSGACAAPVATLSQAWLAVPQDDAGAPGASAIRITSGMPREAKLNTVGGRFVDPNQRYQVLPFPPVRDEVLIAADGEYPGEIDLAGVNSLLHAQRLASIRIRESMAGLRLELSAGVQAYPVELFDVVTLDLPRYGMPAAFGKRAEVIGWSWHPTTGIALQLAEISPDIFTPLAELTGRDPAPNSAFPNPADIETLAITSVSSAATADTDDAIVTRTRVEWTAAVAEAIRAGGHIELQYSLLEDATAGDWPTWEEAGSATSATLVGLLSGRSYLFRVRAVKRWLGLRGPWSTQVVHQVATLPPVAVTFTDFVFRRAATQPATPTGDGTPAGWSDAPPAADGNALWVSIAEKLPPSTLVGSWSTPVQIDGSSLQVEYSVDGASGWHTTFSTGDMYARYRVGDAGAWQGPVKIVGEDGSFTDYIFRRASTQPATPAGDGTPAGWSDAPPAADGNALWVSLATKRPDNTLVGAWSVPTQIDGSSLQVEYSVDGASGWHTTFSTGDMYARYRVGDAGTWQGPVKIVGENGRRTATIVMYRWQSGVPSVFPAGSSTYTWATGAFTAPSSPNGWTTTTGTPGGSGLTLWAVSMLVSDTATSATTAVTWSSASPYAIGTSGEAGPTGTSTHRIYRAVSIGSPPATPSSTTSGATPAGWSATPLTLATGQEQYQADGVTPAGTTTTTWSTPYPSYLKVASLDAITANMGTLTAGSINTTGYVRVEGNSALTVQDTSGNVRAVTVAMSGNTALASDVGLYAASSASTGCGVYGESKASSPVWAAGVFGFGSFGVRGLAKVDPGLPTTAPTAGVVGAGDNTSANSSGVVGTASVAGAGVRAFGYAGATALSVHGPMAIDNATMVTNLNANLLQGSTWAVPDDIGTGFPALGRFTTVVATTADAGGAQVRIKNGLGASGYGAMLRNDGSAFYVLLTNSGNADGAYNSFRPLTIDFAGGNTTITSARIETLTLLQAPATGAAAATFSGTKPGAATTNEWITVQTNSGPRLIPCWPI